MSHLAQSHFTVELADEAAQSFHKAMKGFGTNEKKLIEEVVQHSNSQRQLIKERYLTLFGKSLEESIKSETSGYFETGLLALLEQTDVYEARCLRNAMKGLGTDEKVIIQTVCPKEAHEIDLLRETYNRVFQRDLESDLTSEVQGHLGRILRSLATCGRSESHRVDADLARKEAQELYEAGEGKWGTEESVFIRILCSRSFPQLNATFDSYRTLYGDDIEKAIKKEMSGNLEIACLAIVRAARNKYAYFAHEIHEAMAGLGTRDNDLIRLLVSKSEYNFLPQIKAAYKALYGKSLYDAVKSELSGDYEKLFLTLIGN